MRRNPRGVTKTQDVAIAAGSAIGIGSDFQGMSARVYVLPRDKQGDIAGWDTLQAMNSFERSTLHFELHHTPRHTQHHPRRHRAQGNP